MGYFFLKLIKYILMLIINDAVIKNENNVIHKMGAI